MQFDYLSHNGSLAGKEFLLCSYPRFTLLPLPWQADSAANEMVRKKTFWRGRKEAECKYRFRIRFTRPPGNGVWHSENVGTWLNEKVGRDGWVMYPDRWDGHGMYTYAVHLDDHTIIPELLAFWQQQELLPCYNPIFRASLGPNVRGAIRSAIRELQQAMVDDINKHEQQVTWALGKSELIRGVRNTMYLKLRMDRIRWLGEVETLLSEVPSSGGTLTFQIEDCQRGALEVGVALLSDLKPPRTATIEDLRLLLDAIEEVKPKS